MTPANRFPASVATSSRTDRYSASDAAFEQLLDDVRFSTGAGELTPEKRAARRALADADDLEFARIYFPGIFDSPFNDVHRHIAALSRGIHPIGAFRKAGKTAFAIVGKIIKHLALDQGGIVALALRTQDKAEDRTDAVLRLIRRNELLRYDYDVEIVQDRRGHAIVGSTHLVAVSYKTGLRSIQDDDFKRIRLVVADDLYDRTTVSSETDNRRVVEFVTDEIHGQMEDGALCLVFGNHITADCPIVTLQTKFGAHAYNLPALGADGCSTWPERFSEDYWATFKAECEWDVWQSQYMLTPAVRGEIFQPEWIRPVNLNLITILASVSALDPAHGSSPESCFKGLVTIGATSSSEAVMLDIYLRREGYGRVFDYVAALRARYATHWRALLVEDDFAQWATGEADYRDWLARTKTPLPIIVHNSKDEGAKDQRILTLEHPHRTGKLRYSMELTPDGEAGTDDYKLFRQQLLAFGGNGKQKLDGPDAAATAWLKVFRYISTGSFKPLRKKERERPSWLRLRR